MYVRSKPKRSPHFDHNLYHVPTYMPIHIIYQTYEFGWFLLGMLMAFSDTMIVLVSIMIVSRWARLSLPKLAFMTSGCFGWDLYYICVYVYIYIYTHIRTHLPTYLHTYLQTDIHRDTYTYMYSIHICICIY